MDQARGPVTRGERTLAPDLARGAMLLFIALANAAGVALGGPGFAPHPHGLERGVNFAMLTLAHARAYPVFAVMFGYGLVQLARRQDAAGATPESVRRVLLRRNAVLVIFGFLHAALLYFGDFLAAYGLAGMIATAVLLRRGDRVYRVVLWAWGVSMVYVAVLAGVAVYQWQWGAGIPGVVAAGAVPSLVASTYVDSAKARLTEWPLHTLTVLPFVMIVWLGMWGGRHRLLEDSGAHRRLLKIIAAVGTRYGDCRRAAVRRRRRRVVQTNESALMAIFLLHQVVACSQVRDTSRYLASQPFGYLGSVPARHRDPSSARLPRSGDDRSRAISSNQWRGCSSWRRSPWRSARSSGAR